MKPVEMIDELKVTNSIETETALISLLNDRIVRLEIKDNAQLEFNSLITNYEAYHEILNGEKAPFLVLVNDTASISTEGREEFNKKGMRELRMADALIIKNPATMLLINSQVKFVKPLIPLQAFLNEREGFVWLNSFL